MLLFAAAAWGQSPVTMKQLMLDLIHPAANEILLYTFRGGPQGDTEWAAVRRSALTLAEAGNLLASRAPAREQADWLQDAKRLADAGAAAYQAAQMKDAGALTALTERLDASCTACHQRFRPNVFPRQGGSQ
jgi:hypothetical protein